MKNSEYAYEVAVAICEVNQDAGQPVGRQEGRPPIVADVCLTPEKRAAHLLISVPEYGAYVVAAEPEEDELAYVFLEPMNCPGDCLTPMETVDGSFMDPAELMVGVNDKLRKLYPPGSGNEVNLLPTSSLSMVLLKVEKGKKFGELMDASIEEMVKEKTGRVLDFPRHQETPTETQQHGVELEFNNREALDYVRSIVPQMIEDEMGMVDALQVFCTTAMEKSPEEVVKQYSPQLLRSWWMTPVEALPYPFLDFLFKRALLAMFLQTQKMSTGGAFYPNGVDIEPYVRYGEKAFEEMQHRQNGEKVFLEIQRRRNLGLPVDDVQSDFELTELKEAYEMWDAQYKRVEEAEGKL